MSRHRDGGFGLSSWLRSKKDRLTRSRHRQESDAASFRPAQDGPQVSDTEHGEDTRPTDAIPEAEPDDPIIAVEELTVNTVKRSSTWISVGTPAQKTSASPRLPGLWEDALKALRQKESKEADALDKFVDTPPGELAALAASKIEEVRRRREEEYEVGQKIRKGVENTIELVQKGSGYINAAVSANPIASAAWTVASVLLPIVLIPSQENQAAIRGLEAVVNFMAIYRPAEDVYLDPLDLPDEETVKELRARVVAIYENLLSYEAAYLVHLDRNFALRGGSDIINAGNWSARVANIEGLHRQCRQYMDTIRETRERSYQRNANTLQNAILREIRNGRLEQEIQSLYNGYENVKDEVPKRVEGTCEWFTRHTEFLTWRDAKDPKLLWVTADPGCGKSVLSRYLLEAAPELLRSSSEKPLLCYFFFRMGTDGIDTAPNALCGLLHQLIAQRSGLHRHFSSRYAAKKEKLLDEFESLWRIFEDMLLDPICSRSGVICVLDALDECKPSSRAALVKKLSEFFDFQPGQPRCKVKFIITSRPYDDIRFSFRDILQNVTGIHLAGEDEHSAIKSEIDKVISRRVDDLCDSGKLPGSFAGELKARLIANDNRTYLWLYLIWPDVERRVSPLIDEIELDEILSAVPRDLFDQYEGILGRIHKDQVPKARRLLSIMLAAARPLTVEEAQVALLYRKGTTRYNPPQNASWEMNNLLKNVGGMFIRIADGKLYFIHLSAQEFFIKAEEDACGNGRWQGSFALPDAHALMSEVCVPLLLLEDFKPEKFEERWDEIIGNESLYAAIWQIRRTGRKSELVYCWTRAWFSRHPFVEYALDNYTMHLHSADSSLSTDLMDLVRREYTLIEILRINISRIIGVQFPLDRRGRLLQKSGEIGSIENMELSWTRDFEVQNFAIDFDIPLLFARQAQVLSEGWMASFKRPYWPLHQAAAFNSLEGVRIGLSRFRHTMNVDDKDAGRGIKIGALDMAILRTNWDVAELLLREGGRPLTSFSIIRCLLSERYDICEKLWSIEKVSTLSDSLLHKIVGRRDTKIDMVRWLIRKGCSVNTKDHFGQTALHCAVVSQAASGAHSLAVMQLILSQPDLDVGSKSGNGTTALQVAARSHFWKAIHLLLDRQESGLDRPHSNLLELLLYILERPPNTVTDEFRRESPHVVRRILSLAADELKSATQSRQTSFLESTTDESVEGEDGPAPSLQSSDLQTENSEVQTEISGEEKASATTRTRSRSSSIESSFREPTSPLFTKLLTAASRSRCLENLTILLEHVQPGNFSMLQLGFNYLDEAISGNIPENVTSLLKYGIEEGTTLATAWSALQTEGSVRLEWLVNIVGGHLRLLPVMIRLNASPLSTESEAFEEMLGSARGDFNWAQADRDMGCAETQIFGVNIGPQSDRQETLHALDTARMMARQVRDAALIRRQLWANEQFVATNVDSDSYFPRLDERWDWYQFIRYMLLMDGLRFKVFNFGHLQQLWEDLVMTLLAEGWFDRDWDEIMRKAASGIFLPDLPAELLIKMQPWLREHGRDDGTLKECKSLGHGNFTATQDGKRIRCRRLSI